MRIYWLTYDSGIQITNTDEEQLVGRKHKERPMH